jgi:hypothetical protein
VSFSFVLSSFLIPPENGHVHRAQFKGLKLPQKTCLLNSGYQSGHGKDNRDRKYDIN